MSLLHRFKKELRKQWYSQAGSFSPVYIHTAGWSGMAMRKTLSYGYTKILYRHKENYGEMSYWVPDFLRVWRAMKKRIARDAQYLQKIRRSYDACFRTHEKFFAKKETLAYRHASDAELLALLKRSTTMLVDSVGLGHVIESASFHLEKELEEALKRRVSDARLRNQYFIALTAPTRRSFIAKEERALYAIARLKGDKRASAIRRHWRKYEWLHNTYLGPTRPSLQSFVERLDVLPKKQKVAVKTFSKHRIIQKLGRDRVIRQLSSCIDFFAQWQDDRKVNIQKAIGVFGAVLHAVSARIGIPHTLLSYCVYSEIVALRSLAELSTWKKKLSERRRGLFGLMDRRGDTMMVVGKKYRTLNTLCDRMFAKRNKGAEIRGTIANGGTAVGRVVVCPTLASLKKVQQGDVLVVSMTRPEYMSALRKASAVITDEGGITCHAAIVSRELGIPCIIGTKVATKVLKDGMRVEVRANHGVVKI